MHVLVDVIDIEVVYFVDERVTGVFYDAFKVHVFKDKYFVGPLKHAFGAQG